MCPQVAPSHRCQKTLLPQEDVGHRKATVTVELQALVYDILPSTTAVFSYAIGPRKLSVVSLLQTTLIISDVNFITDHVAYASSN